MQALEQLPPAAKQRVAPRAAQRISHGTSSGPPQATTQAARHKPQLLLSEVTACAGAIAAPENTARGMLLVAPPGTAISSLSPCASRVAFKATFPPTTSYKLCFWPTPPRDRATSVPSEPL